MKAHNHTRHGVLLLEMVAAIAVVAVVVSALAWTFSEVIRLRQQLFRTAMAQQYLANLLEEIDAWELSEVTKVKVAQVKLPATMTAQLPGAQLVIDVADTPATDETHDLVPQRLEVKLSWNDRSGQPRSFVSCSLWKHPEVGLTDRVQVKRNGSRGESNATPVKSDNNEAQGV